MTLKENFFFILHTFSTLHLFSSLGYNLGQNILATSVDDDFAVPLPPIPNVGDSLMLKLYDFLQDGVPIQKFCCRKAQHYNVYL